MKKPEERTVTIDEVRNRAHRVGDAAGDFAQAVKEIPISQRITAIAAGVAAAMSAGFFLGSRRRSKS